MTWLALDSWRFVSVNRLRDYLELCVQQAVEEGTIAAQGYTQIFGGNVVATAPLPFQFAAFFGETVRQSLDHFRDERVRLFDRAARLVHKPRLNVRPSRPEIFCLVLRE